MSNQMPPPGEQPSEEEIRAYVAEMRAAPVDHVLAELLQGLLTAAQMKLGRNDGRLLLDVTARVTATAAPHVDAQLTTQVNEALGQLRMAQVQAEQQVADAGQPEPNDLPERPAPAVDDEGGASQEPPQTPPTGPSAASRLWIPGR